MIPIQDKRSCCGCAACAQRCPKHCITMREDEEGFLYPDVDKEACIGCGLCERVCPELHEGEARTPLGTYAAVNPDESVRMQSSSGGVFTALAEKTIDEGGVVFGVGFDQHWTVRHLYAETRDQLAALRGSKYVQSEVGDSYRQAEAFLKSGRKVLFSGTPCQIAGLRRYLQREYDHLLTVDFVCHGTPSPGVFRLYLKETIESIARQGDKKFSFAFSRIPHIPTADVVAAKAGFAISDIRFRDKREGWKKYSFALSLSKARAAGEQNTVSLSSIYTDNPFMQAFLADYSLRPSCYACPAKSLKSGSDLTLGDFWGIEHIAPSLDDDRGVSLLMVNTDKGAQWMEQIAVNLYEEAYTAVLSYNPSICQSVTCPPKRKFFFALQKRVGFRRAWTGTVGHALFWRVLRKMYQML